MATLLPFATRSEIHGSYSANSRRHSCERRNSKKTTGPPPAVSSPNLPTSVGLPPTLGQKLQQLAHLAPAAVGVIDALVDQRLAEIPTELFHVGVQMKTGTCAPIVRGWQGRGTDWANPRPPAVPASLALSLEEYFAAAALMGLLAAQQGEPDMEWCAEWALKMGRELAAKARKIKR